jgi:alkyl hydroperoxide reductase subunit AhpF
MYVERNGVETERDGAEDFDSCEAHKPDVSAGGEVVVAGKEFIELRSTLVEVEDAQDGIDSGNDADGNWGAEHKDVTDPGVVGEGPAANIFENVKAMALGDII